jgi:hypothetical protein
MAIHKVTTRPDTPPTLQMYYPNLTEKDRALILQAYNTWRVQGTADMAPMGPEAHHGLLPFISMSKIGSALTWKAATAVEYRRLWAELCSKVEASRWALSKDYAAYAGYELVLHSAAVYKHFGPRPDLGVTIPTIPRETCRGPLKWNIGAKEWQYEKISAAPRITLRKISDPKSKKGRAVWLLHAPTRYKGLCINWLLDHC